MSEKNLPVVVTVDLSGEGMGKVFVGSVDVTRHCGGIEVYAKAGRATEVVLRLYGVSISGFAEER